MKESYNEAEFDDSDLDEDTLFREKVIGEDHDLLMIDNLLREAFFQEESE